MGKLREVREVREKLRDAERNVRQQQGLTKSIALRVERHTGWYLHHAWTNKRATIKQYKQFVGIGFILLTYGNLLQSLAVLVTNKSQYAKFPWIYSADFI